MCRLIRALEAGVPHCLFLDGWFGSEKLADVLQAKGLGFVMGCSSVRPAYLWKRWLDYNKDNRVLQPPYEKGDFRWRSRLPGFVAFEWRDNAMVRQMSNICMGNETSAKLIRNRKWRRPTHFAAIQQARAAPPQQDQQLASLDNNSIQALIAYEQSHSHGSTLARNIRALNAQLRPGSAAAGGRRRGRQAANADHQAADPPQPPPDIMLQMYQRILPLIIELYRKYYHGVDMADSKVASIRVIHRNLKWTIHLFWDMLCWACVNACTLYNAREKPKHPMSIQSFVEALVLEIFGSVPHRTAKPPPSKTLHPWLSEPKAKRFCPNHRAQHHNPSTCAATLCAVCRTLPKADSRRTSKTTIFCQACNIALHRQCWDIFHSK